MTTYKFTQSTFDQICLLLKKRLTQSRDDQKKTRAKIRKLGFMISDHFNGFTELDFKELLSKGDIEIIGKQILTATHTPRNPVPKQTIPKPRTSISIQALPPVIDKTTEYLVLGTMPSEQSLLHQQYYYNRKNQFWKIISIVFNDNKPFGTYQDKLATLKNSKIGLWDVLATCDRKRSSDSNIKNKKPNDFKKLFKEVPNIKTLIFNGQNSYDDYVKLIIHDKPVKKHIRLSSTSTANTHKTLAQKTQEWKTALT